MIKYSTHLHSAISVTNTVISQSVFMTLTMTRTTVFRQLAEFSAETRNLGFFPAEIVKFLKTI